MGGSVKDIQAQGLSVKVGDLVKDTTCRPPFSKVGVVLELHGTTLKALVKGKAVWLVTSHCEVISESR